jgi:hypothetical protein
LGTTPKNDGAQCSGVTFARTREETAVPASEEIWSPVVIVRAGGYGYVVRNGGNLLDSPSAPSW